MNRKQTNAWFLVVMLVAGMMGQANAGVVAAAPNPVETKEQRDARMAWWREAKFGMFIHWGLYAVPAGVYKGKQAQPGEWIQNRGKIPVAEYADYAKQFNPQQFDAARWVQLAADAGMKYLVITAKHHDGFAMFKSAASTFTIMEATPFKRDVVRELAEACAAKGIRFGVYYSQSQDWHHPGGNSWHGPWDEAQVGEMDQYIEKIAVPQIRELLSNYGKISVLWFDTPQVLGSSPMAKGIQGMTPARAQHIAEVLKDYPDLVVNNRLGGGFKGDTETPEQHIPPGGYPGRDWETCMTMNNTWGFKNDDHNWKSTETLLRNLIDIASKGGNYLLNVGPTADGVIPQESVERLVEIGKWMRVNGEAIYGTTATPFGAEAGSFDPVKKEKNGKPVFNPSWVWRCTRKSGKLFIHILQWPADGKFEITGLQSKIVKATLLAAPDKAVEFRHTADGIILSLPMKAPDPVASVVRLDMVEHKDVN